MTLESLHCHNQHNIMSTSKVSMKKGQINDFSWPEEIHKHFNSINLDIDAIEYDANNSKFSTEQHALVERIESMFSLEKIPDMTQKILDSKLSTEIGISRHDFYRFEFLYHFEIFYLSVSVSFKDVETKETEEVQDVHLDSYFYSDINTNYDTFDADWNNDEQKFCNYEIVQFAFQQTLEVYELLLQLKSKIPELVDALHDKKETKELKTQLVQIPILIDALHDKKPKEY